MNNDEFSFLKRRASCDALLECAVEEITRLRAELAACGLDAERWRKFIALASTEDMASEEDWWTDEKEALYQWTAYEWRDGKRYDVLPTLEAAIDAALAAKGE